MIKEYKVKIFEGEKSVKQEVEVIGDTQEEVVKATQEVYKELEKFCKLKTLEKATR